MLSKIPISVVLATSFLVAFATLRVVPLGLELAFPAMTHQISNARLMFLLHISATSIALVFGALQIIKTLRLRFPRLHRWIGRAYAIAVLLGGFAGLFIAFEITGLWSTFGFSALAIVWLITTFQAVRLARARKFADHRRWMICSFALTFAAVTLRIQLAIFAFGLSMPYEQVYPILAWSCWIPNFLAALYYIRLRPNLQ